MDIFLIKDGVVANIVSVPTWAFAEAAYHGYTLVERTDANSHHSDGSPVNPGDTLE